MKKFYLDIPNLNTALNFSKDVSEIEPEIRHNIDEAINLSQDITINLSDFLGVAESMKENIEFFSTISQIIGEIIADGCVCEEELLNVLKEKGVDVFTGVLYSFMKNGFLDISSLSDAKLVSEVFCSALKENSINIKELTSKILPNMIENENISYEDFVSLLDIMCRNKTMDTKDIGDLYTTLNSNETIKNTEDGKFLLWQLESYANSSTNMRGAMLNRLGIVYYSQNDPKWENVRYYKGLDSTFGSSACGFTSLAMIVAAKEHDISITPQTIIRDSNRFIREINGFNTEEPACSWNEIELIAAKHGIETTIIRGDDDYNGKINFIFESVANGDPVIVLKTGHYYTVCPGLKEGQVIIMDPFSPNYRRNGVYTPEEAEKIIRKDYVSGVVSFSWD